MTIGKYSTHVDTTGMPAGKTINIYNNDTWYEYEKEVVVEKKAFTKGVSTDRITSSSYLADPYPTTTEETIAKTRVFTTSSFWISLN